MRIEAINIFHKLYYLLKKVDLKKEGEMQERDELFLAAVCLFMVTNMLE